MNIHEYQAKDLLKKYGVAVQGGIVADTPTGRLPLPKNCRQRQALNGSW